MAPPGNRRTGFSRRAQYTLFFSYVVAGGGALLGAVLLIISAIHPTFFSALRSGAAELTTPVSSALYAVRRAILDVPGGIDDYFRVIDRNRQLEAQLSEERAVVLRARTLNIENQRLRRLLEVREPSTATVVTARLVSSSASSTRRYATINAGHLQGLRPGQPVRGPEGLVGRVLETGLNVGRVLLLTDPESIIPVRRTRDGLPAIASGRGDGLLDIRAANSVNAPFEPGDTFVTSGAGGIYPPGIPVARIISRARDGAPARPFANPNSLDFAIVQQPFLPALPPAPPRSGR